MKRLKVVTIASLIVVLAVLCQGARAVDAQRTPESQDWTPSKDFKSQTFRPQTNIVSTTEAATYLAVFRHLVATAPGQVRDIVTCLLKAYVYRRDKVWNTSLDVLLRLLSNPPGRPLANADSSTDYALCKVGDSFARKFEDTFNIDIAEVMAGHKLPLLVSRLLPMTSSTLYTDFYAPIEKILASMKAVLGQPVDDLTSPSENRYEGRRLLESPACLLTTDEANSRAFFNEDSWRLLETRVATEDGTVKTLNDIRQSHSGFDWSDHNPYSVKKRTSALDSSSPWFNEDDSEDHDSAFIDSAYKLMKPATKMASIIKKLADTLDTSLVHMSAYKNRISRKTEQKPLPEGTLHDIHDQPLTNHETYNEETEEPSYGMPKDVLQRSAAPMEAEQIQLLRQQAEAGDPSAQFQLGQYLFFGNDELGIEPQPQEADRFFRMAADNNHNAASINYAIMLINKSNRTYEDEKKAFEILSSPSNKDNAMGLIALSYMYEHGIYVAKNIDRAVDTLHTAVRLKDLYATALYANIVLSYRLKSHFSTALTKLAECIAKEDLYCAYIGAYYLDQIAQPTPMMTLTQGGMSQLLPPSEWFDGGARAFLMKIGAKNGLHTLLQVFRNTAASLASFNSNKKAKTAFLNGESYKAFVYYLYGHSLGDRDASISLLHLVRGGKMAEYIPASSSKRAELVFTLQVAAATANKDKQVTYFNGVGDLIYYGVEVGGRPLEKHENSLKIYRLSNSARANAYAKLSIAYMLEKAEGTEQDLLAAHALYWDILHDSLNDGHGSLFFPALARLALLKTKQVYASLVHVADSLLSVLPRFTS